MGITGVVVSCVNGCVKQRRGMVPLEITPSCHGLEQMPPLQTWKGRCQACAWQYVSSDIRNLQQKWKWNLALS